MTTPSKKPFEFGKAYTDNCCSFAHVVYPLRKSKDDPDGVMAFSASDESVEPYEFEELTRAPEHDLIPRQDVDALIEALQTVVFRVCSDVNLYNSGLLDLCEKALSEFQLKYGENK